MSNIFSRSYFLSSIFIPWVSEFYELSSTKLGATEVVLLPDEFEPLYSQPVCFSNTKSKLF